MGEHRLDAAAVLALEPVDRFQPLLDRHQRARVGLDPLGVVAQLRGDVAQLDRQRRDPLGDRVEAGIEPGGALQQRFGLGQRRRGAAAVLFGPGQPGVGAGGRLAQALGVAQPLALVRPAPPAPRDRARPPRSPRAHSGRGRGRARASPRARAARPARRPAARTRGAPRGTAPAAPDARPRRSRRAPPAAPRRSSACGARAGRRRRAAGRPAASGPPPSPPARQRRRWSARRPRRAAPAPPPRRPPAAAPPARPSPARPAAPRAGRRPPRPRPPPPPAGRSAPFALPPISRSSECARTVFPAPVSPVIALSPSPSRNSARSISSRFSIRSSRSIASYVATGADRPPRFGARCGRLRCEADPGHPRPARRRPAAGLHEVPGADQGEAQRGADEGEDSGDQDDLVEAADEGDVGGMDHLGRGSRRGRHRGRCSRAARGDDFAEAARGVRQQFGELGVDARLEDGAEAGDAGGDPDLAEGGVDPRSHPGFLDRHDGDRRLADAGVGDADADAGDEEADQQRRPLRVGRDAVHQQQADPDHGEPGPEQDPDRDLVARAPRRSARR